MRSVFGWDLPPGVTQRMIDQQYGDDGPCAVCAKPVDLCICPECPVCGSQGDPKCYAPADDPSPGHGITLSREQAASRQEARITIMKDRLQEEEMHLEWLNSEASVDTVFTFDNSPDPWG